MNLYYLGKNKSETKVSLLPLILKASFELVITSHLSKNTLTLSWLYHVLQMLDKETYTHRHYVSQVNVTINQIF